MIFRSPIGSQFCRWFPICRPYFGLSCIQPWMIAKVLLRLSLREFSCSDNLVLYAISSSSCLLLVCRFAPAVLQIWFGECMLLQVFDARFKKLWSLGWVLQSVFFSRLLWSTACCICVVRSLHLVVGTFERVGWSELLVGGWSLWSSGYHVDLIKCWDDVADWFRQPRRSSLSVAWFVLVFVTLLIRLIYQKWE
jgi:hypothetical protein